MNNSKSMTSTSNAVERDLLILRTMQNGLLYFTLERNLVFIVPLVGSRVRVVLSLLSSFKLSGNPAAPFLLSRLVYPYITVIAILLVTYIDQVSSLSCPSRTLLLVMHRSLRSSLNYFFQ